MLWPLGLVDDVLATIEPVLLEDPLSPMPRLARAQALFMRGSRARAGEELQAVLDLHEGFWPGLLARGVAHTFAGETREAIEILERGLAGSPWNPSFIGMLAGNYERAGDRARGEATLARLEDEHFTHFRGLGRCAYHFARGDFDGAADEYASVIESRYPVAAYYFTWLALSEEFARSDGGRRLREQLRLPV